MTKHQLKQDLEANNPKKESNNFLQVGRTVECGHCHPEKFEDCKKISLIANPEFKDYKCNCICHDKL